MNLGLHLYTFLYSVFVKDTLISTLPMSTDTNVKHEHELPEDIISPQSTDGETPVNASLKIIQVREVQTRQTGCHFSEYN